MESDRPLIVFDMDGVLVHERSSWRIIHEALGTSNEDSLLKYMKGEIDDLEFMRRDIQRWKRSAPDLNRGRILEILDGSRKMKGFPAVVSELKEMGFQVIIVSGGLDLLAGILASESGMDGYYANGVGFTVNGDLTGEGILKVPLKDKGSVFDLEEFVERYRGPIITIGDSEVDITMFKRSDLSIAFRPENDKVSENADVLIKDEDLGVLPGIIYDRIGSLPDHS